MFDLTKNKHFRLIYGVAGALLIVGLAVVLRSAWQPRLQWPRELVATAVWQEGENQFSLESVTGERYVRAYRLQFELERVNPLISFIKPLEHPLDVVIDADQLDRLDVSEKHLVIGADVLARPGSLTRAVAKAWLLQHSGPQISGPQISGPQISGPQISGPQIRSSPLRLEVAADVLSIMLGSELRWETLGLDLAPGERLQPRSWLYSAQSFSKFCSWALETPELRPHCESLPQAFDPNAIHPLSLRQPLVQILLAAYQSQSLVGRLTFMKRWAEALRSDTAESKFPVQVGLESWESKLLGDLEALLPVRQFGALVFDSLDVANGGSGKGGSANRGSANRGSGDFDPILREAIHAAGFVARSSVFRDQTLLVDFYIYSPQASDERLALLSDMVSQASKTKQINAVYEVADVFTLPGRGRLGAGSVSVADQRSPQPTEQHSGQHAEVGSGFNAIPFASSILSADRISSQSGFPSPSPVPPIQAKLLIWESCASPTVSEILESGVEALRVLYVKVCEPEHRASYTSLFLGGIESFARANPQVDFLQLQISALRLAERRQLIDVHRAITDLVQDHSSDQTSTQTSTQASDPTRDRAITNWFGLHAAKWQEGPGAYRVLGAIEAIEWFRNGPRS